MDYLLQGYTAQKQQSQGPGSVWFHSQRFFQKVPCWAGAVRETGVALHPSSRKGSPFQAGLGSRQFQASRHPDSIILPSGSLFPFVARFQSA